ncbi:MAG: DNA-3-methyladenine glycosylase family protein [Acidimicrobiales bacterium]
MTPATPTAFDLALEGAGGEPVDLWRTLQSHGLTALPPMALDLDRRTLEITVPVPGGRRGTARTVLVAPAGPGSARVTLLGPRVRPGEPHQVRTQMRRVLRLDEDLSAFYALVATDPDLAWAVGGAGRLVRSPTVFEDVVKTVCTTNCAWSATTRMIGALVEHLGVPAPGATPSGPAGRAFPTPVAMAEAGESFYRDVVRAGYRGRYLATLAASVADGTIDLEDLDAGDLPDEEIDRRLQALPGVGPYAACHVMVLLGRYSRLILDSWTRPKFARLVGRPSVADDAIVDRFSRYGRWAGLAFWLFLTADWIETP